MAVALYAFRQANDNGVWVIVPGGRMGIPTDADRVQMGIASSDVRILDPGNPLFQLPIVLHG